MMEMMIKAVAVLCVFGLGMCFSLLGAISVKLMPRLGIDQGKFGWLISAFMGACLVASLVMGVVTDSLGYQPVAVFGFVVTALCILMLAQGKSFAAVLLPCLLLGFGAMALNTAGNTMIPVVLFEGKNPAAASNLGNVFFGAGLLLTPLLLSYLFRKTSYKLAISALAGIVLIPLIPALLADYPASTTGFQIADTLRMLVEPAVWCAALALFCYASLDATFSNWLPAFGKEVILEAKPETAPAAADASAQRLISVYAVALIVGRLIASQIPAITAYGTWFIAAASLLTAPLILVLTNTKNVRPAWTLVFVAGLLSAPFFPTIVGIMAAKYDANIFGSVFGIIFAGALLGGTTVPKLIGNLAEGSTIQRSLKLLIPLCLILVVLVIILGQLDVRRQEHRQESAAVTDAAATLALNSHKPPTAPRTGAC